MLKKLCFTGSFALKPTQSAPLSVCLKKWPLLKKEVPRIHKQTKLNSFKKMKQKLSPHQKVAVVLLGFSLSALVAACTPLDSSNSQSPVRIWKAVAPSADEAFCAWFGDARNEILYFGLAPFWSALRRAGGDSAADARIRGPLLLGRFDLVHERFLEPLTMGSDEASGTWDVLVHPNGRLYFTTYFGHAGSVDPESGRVERFPTAGKDLVELAPGPPPNLLATRYRTHPGGALVLLSPKGELRAEYALAPAGTLRAAAKSAAYDPARREYWVNTDLFSAAGTAAGHDARILDARGHELVRYADPELQFLRFDARGRGYLVERSGAELWLRLLPASRPDAPRPQGTRILLDANFLGAADFAQDLHVAADGTVLVTRWSGNIHVITPDGRARRLSFPSVADGLYYSAALHGDRVCVTLCAEVAVACSDLVRAN